jgi:tetratricopeptide (TPR) repeat protein
MGSLTLAQKKELKSAERAIKNNDYASAKASISAAEALMSSMDDKLKAKFYFLKGQAFYAAGSGNDSDITTALKNFSELEVLENTTGKKTYSPKAADLKLEMSKGFIEKAQNALSEKNYNVSYKNFEKAFRVSPTDTLYLYNAALLATSGKEYDESIRLYDELKNLNYTGITMEYLAVDKATGEEVPFANATMRDLSVKAGTHEKPRDNKTKSKKADIVKNIAFIYIEKGEDDKALAAIETAKKNSPNDFNLIVSEANVRYKMGEKEAYRSLIKQALELQPDNIDLIFNLGIMASEVGDNEEAKKYYKTVISKEPNSTRGHMNMAVLILGEEQTILDEMSKLGMSAADDKKYEELKAKKNQIYKDAVPHLVEVMRINPKAIEAARTLMNIYSALDDTANFDAIKAKVDAMETGN